jgi:ubiquinone/menaquinone biosynthesis C-methylase UbiE
MTATTSARQGQLEAATAADPLAERVRATWTAGDFGRIARGYAPGAAAFVTRLGVHVGERVLDVACGTGNLTLPAARAGAHVTGLDIAPSLLAQARLAADAQALRVQLDEGDCTAMPYATASFDTVLSMFGAMFAAPPQAAADELLRVCRPGGRIAMANWTPEGFIGRMFKATAAHVPPPGVPSPLLWGDEAAVRERLRDGVAELYFNRRTVAFRLALTPEQTVDFFREWYGPTLRAFASLGEDGQAALRRDLTRLWSEHNLATDGTTHVESEYLEVVATKRGPFRADSLSVNTPY